jgi:CRP/FNR family transcriptional regulator
MKCYKCLSKSEAAHNLDAEQLSKMESNCGQVKYEAGEVIFKQNALSSNIIYIRKGLVKTTLEINGRQQILKINKAPAYLGLPTTIGDKINHYSAVSITDVSACIIDINVFNELLRVNSDFSYDIILSLCKSELEYLNACFNRMQKQSAGRLAESLLYFSESIYNADAFTLPLTRCELGNLTGNSREIVSRTLQKFHQDEIIAIDGKLIKILDKKRLNQICKSG